MTQERIPLGPSTALALLVASFVIPRIVPEAFLYGLIGGLVGALAVLVWWLFFSRTRWLERLSALLLMAVALAATKPFLDVSIATAGQGSLFYIFAIPLLSLALAAWAIAARRLEGGARWASMIATLLLASAVWTLLRTGGVTGDGQPQFAWRWSPTPEDRLLALAPREIGEPTSPVAPAEVKTPTEPVPAPPRESAKPAELPAAQPTPEAPAPARAEHDEPAPPISDLAAAGTGAEWPGFRGPARAGVVPGLRIEPDWSKSPPVELWRRPVGPGWSSFAVAGDLLYTQEQRGDEEIVAAYTLEPASRCGCTATRSGSTSRTAAPGLEEHRPSGTAGSTRSGRRES